MFFPFGLSLSKACRETMRAVFEAEIEARGNGR